MGQEVDIMLDDGTLFLKRNYWMLSNNCWWQFQLKNIQSRYPNWIICSIKLKIIKEVHNVIMVWDVNTIRNIITNVTNILVLCVLVKILHYCQKWLCIDVQ
jgi:hypothetical protein